MTSVGIFIATAVPILIIGVGLLDEGRAKRPRPRAYKKHRTD